MKTLWNRKPWICKGSAAVKPRFITLVTGLTMLAVFLLQARATNPELANPIESLEQHAARTAWWREARFGMFIHSVTAVCMLGASEAVNWYQSDSGLALSVPPEKPCRHAFVYRVDFKAK